MTIYLQGKDQTVAKAIVSTKTDSYTVTAADFGKTLRMTSADAKIFTLPSVGSPDDGARLTFVKLGAGRVTIQAVDSDIIGDSAATGTMYADVAGEIYATLNLEYVHGSVKWVVCGAHGTWTTT